MAVKRYSELKASDWRTPATVYLLEGEEPVLQREFLAQLRRALQVEAGSIDEAVLDARETPTATVGATVQTIPMESERRLVILTHANRSSPNELQALARLVEQVPPFACLVLLPAPADESEGAKAAWNALAKAVEKHGLVVKLTALTGASLTRRLVAEAHAAANSCAPKTPSTCRRWSTVSPSAPSPNWRRCCCSWNRARKSAVTMWIWL
jgi:hypothetical protein